MSETANTKKDGEESPDNHPCYVVKERVYYSFWNHTWVINEPTIVRGKAKHTTYKVCSVCGLRGDDPQFNW